MLVPTHTLRSMLCTVMLNQTPPTSGSSAQNSSEHSMTVIVPAIDETEPAPGIASKLTRQQLLIELQIAHISAHTFPMKNAVLRSFLAAPRRWLEC